MVVGPPGLVLLTAQPFHGIGGRRVDDRRQQQRLKPAIAKAKVVGAPSEAERRLPEDFELDVRDCKLGSALESRVGASGEFASLIQLGVRGLRLYVRAEAAFSSNVDIRSGARGGHKSLQHRNRVCHLGGRHDRDPDLGQERRDFIGLGWESGLCPRRRACVGSATLSTVGTTITRNASRCRMSSSSTLKIASTAASKCFEGTVTIHRLRARRLASQERPSTTWKIAVASCGVSETASLGVFFSRCADATVITLWSRRE
jgi:hypothetical protein